MLCDRRHVTRRHMAVNIRMFVQQANSLDELVELATLTAARFLEAAVAAGLDILVSGGTEAGNTDACSVTSSRTSRRGCGWSCRSSVTSTRGFARACAWPAETRSSRVLTVASTCPWRCPSY